MVNWPVRDFCILPRPNFADTEPVPFLLQRQTFWKQQWYTPLRDYWMSTHACLCSALRGPQWEREREREREKPSSDEQEDLSRGSPPDIFPFWFPFWISIFNEKTYFANVSHSVETSLQNNVFWSVHSSKAQYCLNTLLNLSTFFHLLHLDFDIVLDCLSKIQKESLHCISLVPPSLKYPNSCWV